MTAANRGLKLVRLDGVTPNAENLANGTYRLGASACFLYKDSVRDPAARTFINFVFSTAGEEVIRKLAMLPIPRSAGGAASP